MTDDHRPTAVDRPQRRSPTATNRPNNALAVATVVLLLSCSVRPNAALKVLGLFPHPGASHWHFYRPVMHGLAERGHDVTVVSLFPWADAPANYHDIVIPGEVWTHAVDLQDEWFLSRRRYGAFYELGIDMTWGQEACESAYNTTGVQQLLRDRPPFDVIVMEQFNNDCMMGIAWALQAPVVAMSSCPLMPWHYDRVGLPQIASFIPSLHAHSGERMSFGERMRNWIDIQAWRYLYRTFIDTQTDRLLRELFGAEIPPVAELVKSTSAMLVNQHHSLSGARPLSPAVVELGGIHISAARPLPDELQRYLDEASEGVVLVSWGSMVHAASMPVDKRDEMVRAFGALQQRVLWKWENDTLPQQPANVRIVKWIPQRDVLCHRNVRVFVTHGGLLGGSEAVHCAVPSVITPMYGDQFVNGAAFVNRGMGAIVAYEELTERTLFDAVERMLRPEAQRSARDVAQAFNERLSSPKDTALWWVEHVARTGGAPLSRPYSVHMSAWTYHSLDVIAVLLAAALLVAFGWWWAISRCLRSAKAPKSAHRSQRRQHRATANKLHAQ